MCIIFIFFKGVVFLKRFLLSFALIMLLAITAVNSTVYACAGKPETKEGQDLLEGAYSAMETAHYVLGKNSAISTALKEKDPKGVKDREIMKGPYNKAKESVDKIIAALEALPKVSESEYKKIMGGGSDRVEDRKFLELAVEQRQAFLKLIDVMSNCSKDEAGFKDNANESLLACFPKNRLADRSKLHVFVDEQQKATIESLGTEYQKARLQYAKVMLSLLYGFYSREYYESHTTFTKKDEIETNTKDTINGDSVKPGVRLPNTSSNDLYIFLVMLLVSSTFAVAFRFNKAV